ncbi:helix-turn-helix domain-containing protein [Aerococcaceae bacterium DSM 111021]|nr:helix-turn-helix domain-containing protein [Aerococcaceae bacterium DSM 111021]
MQHIGPLIKRIRLDKGLTLKETSEGIISIAFLSKFENQKNDISVSNLFALLQRLKISPDEFYRLTSRYNSTPMYQFLQDLLPGLVNNDIIFLNKKLDELSFNIYTFDSIFVLHYKILIEQYINLYSKLPYNNKDINTISKYLIHNENWGNYELHLYSNFIKFLPLHTNLILIKKAKNAASSFVGTESYKHTVVLLYINFINMLIVNNELLAARDTIKEIMPDLIDTKYFYEINKLNYLEGKIMIASGKITEGKRIAEKAIDIMYQLQNSKIARAHKKSLDEFINSFLL